MRTRIRLHLALVAAVAIAAPALGADNDMSHAAMQLEPGLWEFAQTQKVSGDTVIADKMLARVPPEQREQFLAEMRRMLEEPHKVRECMTQAKFEQQVFLKSTGCTETVVSNTASLIEIKTACRTDNEGTQDLDHKIAAASPTSLTSSLHAVVARDGKTMTVDSTEIARRLGADCGDLKENEIREVQ